MLFLKSLCVEWLEVFPHKFEQRLLFFLVSVDGWALRSLRLQSYGIPLHPHHEPGRTFILKDIKTNWLIAQ